MGKIVATFTAISFAALVIFWGVLAGTLMGALCGWIVGFFFSETILSFFAGLGITGLKMWQIGANLGFIGGFIRSVSTK